MRGGADEWRRVALCDIGAFRNGVNFTRDDMGDSSHTTHRLINVKDVFRSGTCLDALELDGLDLPVSRATNHSGMKAGDIYFVRSSVKREGVGRVSLARESDDRVVHCGFLIRFRLHDEAVDPTFLAYALGSSAYRDQIVNLSSGSAITNLSQKALGELPVTVPPLPVQRKIAAVLSAHDDLIETNNRRIKLLEEMAHRIYREWFVDLRFPGHERVPSADSEFGMVPRGWRAGRLEDICAAQRQAFDAGSHAALPLLDMARMRQGSIAVSDFGDPEELKTSRIIFEAGDVLFGSIRPNLRKVALAPVRGVTNTSVLVIRAHSSLWQPYLAVLLSSEAVNRWATQRATGTKMPVIPWTGLRTMPILLPPESLGSAFADLASPILREVQVLSASITALEPIRDLLLPRLISRGIDVTDLDIAMPEAA